MPDYAGDKSLEPTPHRRQQARQEGHVAKSQDLGSAAMLLSGVGVLMMLGGGLAGFLVELLPQPTRRPAPVDDQRGFRRRPMERHALDARPLPAADSRTALPGGRGRQRAANRVSLSAAAGCRSTSAGSVRFAAGGASSRRPAWSISASAS